MTLPDKLTAAEFERLKAQEQRMLNSGSWVPQSEDRLTAQVNAAAADSAAPESMTAEQADVAEAQQSVMAETQFGSSVGIRPDYSQPPAKDPAEDEPKTIGELRKRQQDLYNDPSYDMPFEEWQDFTRWQKQNESEVGSFIGGLPGMAQSLGQLGVGLVKERAQQAYRATAGLDPIGAAATEVATFKEMGRKIGVGLTQLSDWVGGKVNDIVESGRRVGQVQQNVIRALRDSGQLTGDPIQDNTTIQKALEEAAAQGMYEPTQQQAEEDEEVGYQRYQRKKAYDREYAGITEFSIGGNRMTLPDVKETVTMPTLLPNTEQSKGVNVERQVFQPQEATATVGAMALSPENALPIGVGVLARARMLRRLASVTGTPLRATETAMASVDDWLARTADRVTSKVPFVGDLPLNQRAYALGAAGGVGAYLDATTDSPVIDVIAKPLIVAGLVLPAAKAAGGTIRRVGAGAGAGWQVIKEMDAGAVGSARAETAARMAASGKFNPRYSKYMERGAQGGVESTLRRVSQNPEMPETLRRIARSADNIGITQVARGIDDAVSSSVAAGIAATPFALVAPDSETAGGIVGSAVLLGGTLGTAGRVIGRRSARTDADIARMMVDVEMAGGDAGSLGALSYSGLDLLAAMQGITSGKVDFVPLRAQEYRANADVRASGGETVAGLHIEKAADGRAKVYVNMGHTAPIAGRVSIKPIQITRNGKTEDANVVRIKGEDGQSDFTVVPREYPLLVKSGDFVEPNARLARGLSPTHVMPHEIGHAILTSSILNGSIRDDLRNLVNQRYDTAGVEARGREYVTRIVDKDILAGAHDQLPDKLTQQEFDEISSGRRTMADVLKGKPVSDAQREQMITDRYNEMRERSIAEGNNPDGLDVFRDEIVAETFSSLSDSLDFRRMRAGGPQVMESVLAATARVFETMGVKFDRSTGKLMDNPSVVFRDNPLMQDPIMRKRMQEHLRNYEAWMLGMEQAGAREQKGTQISVDGSAESARRSTHTKLRANDNGVLENDLIYIDQNGQAQWKPQKMLDEQEKGRSAQVGQLYDKSKILPPNSAEFGLRRAGVGRTVISGPTLPAKFDVLRWFPKHIREMARMLEAGREGGASHIFDYNTIGTGEGGRYRVINRGDVRAIIREGAFLGWEATKNGHLKAVVMDLNAFRSAAMRAINRGELGIFNNDMSQLQADLMVYLANHKNGLPGEATIGQQKRDMLNGLIGTGTAVQRDINPLYADLNPRGSVRSFRFDRINDITPTGRDGYHFDYDKLKHNRMPSALPQAGMAMPEGPVGPREATVTQDGLVQAPEDAPTFTLPRRAMAQFMPDTGIRLEDYADRPIVALPADRMGIGQMRVGPKDREQILSVPGQGGAGFMEIYNGGGWAFTDTATADRFLGRLREVARPGENSVIVGITALNEVNHLKNQTGQLAYVEALEAAINSKAITKKQADAHIREISKRIYTSDASPKALTPSTRSKFKSMRGFDDFQKAVRAKQLNFADAAWLLDKMQQKTLPLPYKDAQAIGIAFDDVARQTADPRYADVPFGTVVALLEVPINQAPSRNPFHYAYPAKVEGNRIGFLSKFQNIDDLTSDPRIRNKQGRVTAQPLQTVLPVMDRVGQAPRGQAMPDVADISTSTSVAALQKHPMFKSAKYDGSAKAAFDIVESLVKPKAIQDVMSKINPNRPAYIIPVIAREGDSANMLPLAMAEKLSAATGIPVWLKLAKTSSQHNTGAKADSRARTMHRWEGEPPPAGSQIVLVDDTYTTGQTLRSLASVVGDPDAVATISVGRYTKQFTLQPDREQKLLAKAGLTKQQFINLYGSEPKQVLTGAQAQQYLLNGARGQDGLLARFPADRGGFSTQAIAGLTQLPEGVTTFSGGGLVEMGLRGIVRPTVAVEYSPAIAQAYRAAHGDHVKVQDIRTVSLEDHKGKFHYHASPVCKNSSLLKSAALGGGEKDLDIESAQAVARHIDEIEPKVVTIENVPDYAKTQAADIIRQKLQERGYMMDEKVYNAAEFGAPTARRRYLLRAVKGGLLPEPAPQAGPGWYSTVADMIDTLPDDSIARAQYIYRSLREQGVDPDNVTEPLLVSGTTLFKKVAFARPSEPAFTFKATPATVDRILLPGGRVKRVTARAKARMTGIPDDYPLPKDEKTALTIIGNGVPPALVRNVFGPVIEANKQ